MNPVPSHLIFDCDPGCDDAVAIAYILAEQRYDTIDFLTVAGNVAVEQTTENTRRILAACKRVGTELRIYRGCARSLMADEPSAVSVHGRDGLGDAPNSLLRPSRLPKIQRRTAIERLLEISRDVRGFDLLCTGPLTDIATALSLMTSGQRSRFFKNCRRFVVMGGVFNSLGNITHSSEFNTFADPAAAQIVLSFLRELEDAHEICFVPLDSTEKVGVPLKNSVWKEKAKDATPARNFLRYALQQYGRFHVFSNASRPRGADIKDFNKSKFERALLEGASGVAELEPFCYLHDALAAWALVNVETTDSQWKDAIIRIDTGHGESRGRVIVGKDYHPGPFASSAVGTKVRWLFLSDECREKFLQELRTLLGIGKRSSTAR